MVTDIYEMIPRGYSLVLTGSEGSGKTTFLVQWIMKGCNEGKHGIYVTYDEKPDDLRKNAAQMGWDLHDLENVGLLTIFDGFSPRIGIKSKEEYTTRPDVDYLLLKIAPLLEKHGTKHVVIDSITSLLISTRIYGTTGDTVVTSQSIKQRVALIRMGEFLKGKGITTIYAEVSTSNEHPQLEQFLVDGVIKLELMESAEGLKRRLLVKKMRGKEHPMQYMDFSIVKGQGVVFK